MTEFQIAEPGIYPGIPDRIYHADPYVGGSFSSTQAKDILESPATYMWKREHPQTTSNALEFGTLVHSLVLGVGTMPVEIPDDILASNGAASTKEAKAFIQEQREQGNIPMKAQELEKVQAVADAVKAHPLVAELMADGEPEVSFFAPDPQTGVVMRGRVDWVTKANSGETLLVDLKTSRSAQPTEFARNAASLNYAVQMEWYRAMWEQLTGEKKPRFLHVVVEKEAPYLVSVCEMNADFQDIGRIKMRQAIDTYKQCLDTGEWPGIPPIVHPLLPPAYYMAELLDLESEIEI